jgi:uncharacterized protein (TIGR02594 family)
MRLANNKRAAVLLCSVAFALLTVPAQARPAHKAKHTQHRAVHTAAVQRSAVYGGPGDSASAVAIQPTAGEATQGSRRTRRGHTGDAFGGFTTNSLVSEARSYLGTNPTGRGSQWCGAFMDLVLKKTGHAGGGNLAYAYARYGTRVSGPQVGAIAVMNHHVGVVSGIDPNGNPIIVSGNHNRTVAESVYPRSRIAAYVMPGG